MRGKLRIFSVPGSLHWKKAIYDDSYLASLFQVPEPIWVQGMKLGIFPSPGGDIESQSLYGRSAYDFYKSQGLYIGRKVYMTTRTLFRFYKSESLYRRRG